MNQIDGLLTYSTLEDVEKTIQTLTPDQIKSDISVFTRLLVNAYCGWPFLDDKIKNLVIERLSSAANIDEPTHIYMFEEMLINAITPIVDKHLRVGGYKYRSKRLFVNIGNNLATYREKYKFFKTDDNIAVAAIASLNIKHKDEITKFVSDFGEIIKDSRALIIDLRGNQGGSNTATRKINEQYLYGADTPVALKIWIRGTDEAKIIYKNDSNYSSCIEKCDGSDPIVTFNLENYEYPKFGSKNPGYINPIYILTDQFTGSAAEMTCSTLLHHPTTKRVGDNTSGCEENGNQTSLHLPNSKILFRFGTTHRELEIKNFEDNGYPPNIRCKNGQDAYDFALQELRRESQE